MIASADGTSKRQRRARSAQPAADKYAVASGSTICSRVKGEYLNPGKAPTTCMTGRTPNMHASATAATASQNHRERARRFAIAMMASGIAINPR